ncbi:competence/damage-inducible protein A [Hoeflea prorocentri]|uniref:Competence/damage-inducible protein A n=1 Tax=Hoeflea prorocentri TaxID=1922333 RepID=A0A9X3ZH53_9HYPH|nr:competence/damage-inducible protein A [Hoeflea prorocentri]MCY6380536.1 competence/damage-inducible protein A [Hoeflea prorocentri]MDA5398336.1 competence/damage-inducible protein A [Hoeflea prorocentri]
MSEKIVTAGMVAIGDELLSGKTKDRNIAHLADMLTTAGIELKEVRIVADETDAIVEAVNALRTRYSYVFTSGGIGPTHDDITADAISRAFDLPCEHDREALDMLGAVFQSRNIEFTDARKRMARMPRGASHIRNRVSVAPGFTIGNVHVMAGVPSIFQAMLDWLLPRLETGAIIHSETVDCPYGEGTVGEGLEDIQNAHPDTVIGSYPKFDGKNYSTQIVVRSRDTQAIQRAVKAVNAMLVEIAEENPA